MAMKQERIALFRATRDVMDDEDRTVPAGSIIIRKQSDPVGVLRWNGTAFTLTPNDFRSLILLRPQERRES